MEEKKQKLIEALKVSSNSTAKEYLKRFFGIDIPKDSNSSQIRKNYEFKPFDKVLVRYSINDAWKCDLFSNYIKSRPYPYIVVGGAYKYCVPYNEQTAHLIGTDDDWVEEKINRVMITITFKDVYQLPLNMDFYGHIFSFNGVIAFNIVDDNSYSLAKDLIDNINGHSKRKYRNVYYKEGCIYIDNKPILAVRGFGFLIGTGGLNLTFEEAAKIQDDFCNWVVAILKGIS